MKNPVQTPSLLLLIAITTSSLLADKPLKIEVELSTTGTPISEHLVGLHQVYSFTPDKVFQDSAFPDWVRESGVSTSRFPGGSVVKYWDWENPTGQPFVNHLDKAFDPSQNPPESEWMSLDEFIDFTKRTGIDPFFGVNSLTGITYDVEQAYIAKAARMVEHVKERGLGGGLWYIGNEEAFKHGGMAGYAQTFSRYARAMKAVDPEIRIFWNDNNPNRDRIREFLANDDGMADGLETHGKWPFGGDPGMEQAGFGQWRNEVPLRDRKNGDRKAGGRIWRDAAKQYKDWAAEAGRDLLIANNEYGLGKSKYLEGFDRYSTGLLMTEMLMEHFIGGWFASCFWDLTRGTENGLLDPQNDYRLNPFHMGMDLLADCQGGEFLHTIETPVKNIHGFAARKDRRLFIYLINKSAEDHSVDLAIPGKNFSQPTAFQMQSTPDGYGQLVSAVVRTKNGSNSINLPTMTFTRIEAVNQDGYPLFSWDTVPVYIHYGNPDGYTDEAIEFIASKSNFVCMEKTQGKNVHGSVEKGQIADAKRLKAANPDIKVLFYWNTFLDYSGYDAHEVYQDHPEWWLRKLDGELDFKTGTLKRYDLSNPEVREWWTDVVQAAVAEGPCDGVFMDAFPQITSPANNRLWGQVKYDAIQTGLAKTIELTREKAGSDAILMYNGIRNTDTLSFGMQYIDHLDAATIEHFGYFHSSSPDAMARDMAAMMEAGKRGKIVVFKGWPGFAWIDSDKMKLSHGVLLAEARENITFPLACFLVAAQPHSYFCYSWGYQQHHGSLNWYPELDKPLGKPLEDAKIDGYTYTREFEHCRVRVDLESREARIEWKK